MEIFHNAYLFKLQTLLIIFCKHRAHAHVYFCTIFAPFPHFHALFNFHTLFAHVSMCNCVCSKAIRSRPKNDLHILHSSRHCSTSKKVSTVLDSWNIFEGTNAFCLRRLLCTLLNSFIEHYGTVNFVCCLFIQSTHSQKKILLGTRMPFP